MYSSAAGLHSYICMHWCKDIFCANVCFKIDRCHSSTFVFNHMIRTWYVPGGMGKPYRKCCVAIWRSRGISLQGSFFANAPDSRMPWTEIHPFGFLPHISFGLWNGRRSFNHHSLMSSRPLWVGTKFRCTNGGGLFTFWFLVQVEPQDHFFGWVLKDVIWNGREPRL